MKEMRTVQIFERPADMDQVDESFLQELFDKVERERNEELHLGEGKSAVVWYTENPQTHNLICVKELRSSDASVNSFQKELALQDVAYKQGVEVPAPYFYISNGEHEYIFMERFIGLSVKDMLARGQYLDDEAFDRFYRSLGQQLLKLHRQAKVFHRDLHTGNVMVMEDGTAAIIDFGDAIEDVGQFDSPNDIYRQDTIREGRYVTVRFPNRDESILKEVQKLRQPKEALA